MENTISSLAGRTNDIYNEAWKSETHRGVPFEPFYAGANVPLYQLENLGESYAAKQYLADKPD